MMADSMIVRGVTRRARVGRLFAFLTGLLLIVVALRLMPLTINVTPSMPIGLYALGVLRGEIKRGDIVQVCAPAEVASEGLARGYLPAGPCPGGAGPLLKIVIARNGDTVEVEPSRLSVDGVPVPSSATRDIDSQGRPLV